MKTQIVATVEMSKDRTINASLLSLMSVAPPILKTSPTWSSANDTSNMTGNINLLFRPGYGIWQALIIGFIFTIIIVGTLVGNTLVCMAVSMVRKLRSPSNLIIVSLAVADMLVAVLVMPFAALLELRGRWDLGQTFCNTWTSLDVMLCTASILNLCMISVDRYFVITRPFQYAMKRTPKRMALMIIGVWVVSALISIPPLFGWKSEGKPGLCIVSQAIGYQFYATIGSFYLPLGVMIFIYFRIYRVSARLAATEARSMPNLGLETQALNSEHNSCQNGVLGGKRESSISMLPKKRKKFPIFNLFKKSNLNKISSSKDRKATKTLGVIMGAFTACWLPFFILALIRPFVGEHIPHWLNSLFLWLGYCNSFLNPIIYARFNREFRKPFKEIICCRCRGINYRLRSECYMETYGGAPRGSTTLKDAIRLPTDTVVRYNSEGQTIVKPFGNGNSKKCVEAKV